MGITYPSGNCHCCSIEQFLQEKSSFIVNSLKVQHKNEIVGFIGGPPCPDFSVGGKNKGQNGENGRLSGIYIDLIVKNNPDFFLFENVRGLWRTKKHREFYECLKAKLRAANYQLTEKLINAISFGAPQDRDRIILLGFKRGLVEKKSLDVDQFPWGKEEKYPDRSAFEFNWPAQEEYEEYSIKPVPRDIPFELTVEHWFQKNDVERHPNAKNFFNPRAALPKFQSIPEGDDLKKSFKRLHRWRYSPTAAYGNNEVHVHPYKSRRLSAAEALAIQSLPKEYSLPAEMTLSNMFKCIGNGVPYVAAKGLADTIKVFLKE